VVVGIGMTMFQQFIPRPGLATGLYMNTRRIGSIVSGPIITLASVKALGYPGLFAACAVLTVVALIIIEATRRAAHRVNTPRPEIVPTGGCPSRAGALLPASGDVERIRFRGSRDRPGR
jgi:MFS transporter, SET family, sugar efflux transporter